MTASLVINICPQVTSQFTDFIALFVTRIITQNMFVFLFLVQTNQYDIKNKKCMNTDTNIGKWALGLPELKGPVCGVPARSALYCLTCILRGETHLKTHCRSSGGITQSFSRTSVVNPAMSGGTEMLVAFSGGVADYNFPLCGRKTSCGCESPNAKKKSLSVSPHTL